MANNGYRQPYRQGPPPQQQQYYNDQYDSRDYNSRDYNEGQQGHGYDQRYDNHDGYGNVYHNEQPYPPHNASSGPYARGNDRQYQEPNYQDQYDQRSPPSQGRGQNQGSYQYDERYRSNGQGRPSTQNPQGRPPTRSGDGRGPPQLSHHPDMMSRGRPNPNYNDNGARPPKVRERILQQQPESPKASWDNPFPTFPSKKKQGDSKNAGTSDSRGVEHAGQDIQRPSTSYSSRSRPDMPRPSTSQSQRHFEPLGGVLDAPAMPIRTDSAGLRSQAAYQQDPALNGDLGRPAPPRRAMTGPAPEPHYDDFRSINRSNAQYEGPGDGNYSESPVYSRSGGQDYHGQPLRNRPADRTYENSGQQNLPEPQNTRNRPSQNYKDDDGYEEPVVQTYPHERGDPSIQPQVPTGQMPQGTVNGHRRQSSDQSFRRKQIPVAQDYDSNSYRGVPLAKKISPEVPNFDAIANSPTEKYEDHLGASQKPLGQPYHKPTYQHPTVAQVNPHQRQTTDDESGLSSPLAQFSFDLDPNQPPRRQNTSQMETYHEQPYQPPHPGQTMQRRPPPLGPDRPMQFPQRGASRSNDVPPSSPYGLPQNRPGQGVPPIRPGLMQQSPPRQEYERGYQGYDNNMATEEPEYPPHDNYRRPGMPSSQASYHSDTTRQGYDQRIQPPQNLPAPYQVPPRPATSNSARRGPGPDYNARISSDSYQQNNFQNPDSLPAHPAPFRPGLMQPTPPAPRPTPPPQVQAPPLGPPQPQMHQRAPSAPKPAAKPEPPITIGELNQLREACKNRPNDYALGLKFAKKLVEAARVLANENGRADPKQTAKNRERYILDGHKIVKRLCSSSYPEAMFYMADCYGSGMLGLATDSKEAFQLYQSAAKLGHPQAAYRAAVCCELGAEEGGGTRRDPLKAVQWYKRAASLGDTPAMYKMGMIQLKGLLSQPKSPREAISWLKRAAERADAENPHALHELGLLYENAQPTDIVLKDEKYALELFQQAADLEYKYSQFRLGSAFEYGLLGLPIDPRMSIAWYSRAAKQGEHQSEFALSGWYLTGSGQAGPGETALLQQSDTEAYLWARKAASSGLAKAEYAMGYYTEVGIGVASNIEEAKRWYYRAAAQNHPKARERLEDLKRGGQRMQKTRVSRSNVGKHNEGECAVM